jgi:hypothetical protein
MRLIPALFLALLAIVAPGIAAAAVTTTTVDLRVSSSDNPNPTNPAPANKVVGTSTCDTDEDILVIQVSPGAPRWVELYNAAAWHYRSAASGTNRPIAAGQSCVMLIEQTTTIYHTRQSADGAVVVTCIKAGK